MRLAGTISRSQVRSARAAGDGLPEPAFSFRGPGLDHSIPQRQTYRKGETRKERQRGVGYLASCPREAGITRPISVGAPSQAQIRPGKLTNASASPSPGTMQDSHPVPPHNSKAGPAAPEHRAFLKPILPHKQQAQKQTLISKSPWQSLSYSHSW